MRDKYRHPLKYFMTNLVNMQFETNEKIEAWMKEKQDARNSAPSTDD